MSKRGERAAAFLQKAALYIDDRFEEQCCQRPYADGTYQGHIRFNGLSAAGKAQFARQMYSDKARTKKRNMVRWEESPTALFRTLKRELQWDATGLQQFEQISPVHAEYAKLMVGAKFPSAWVRAAQAMAAAPRLKP